jgi:hypothetical protein
MYVRAERQREGKEGAIVAFSADGSRRKGPKEVDSKKGRWPQTDKTPAAKSIYR